MSVTTRLLALDDAPAMAALLRDNREFLKPTDPVRPEEYFTDDGQRQVIADVLRQWENGFAQICRVAFGELDLHRLEAGTLVHNTASQRVLEKNGFVQYGSAPGYLRIAGRWQDHLLFQRLSS